LRDPVSDTVSDTVSETRSHDCSGHALSRQVRGSDPRTWLAGTRRVRTPGVSPGVRLWDDDLALVLSDAGVPEMNTPPPNDACVSELATQDMFQR
jgi:hypothetical protein